MCLLVKEDGPWRTWAWGGQCCSCKWVSAPVEYDQKKVSLDLVVEMEAVCSSCCFLEGGWMLPPWLEVFLL